MSDRLVIEQGDSYTVESGTTEEWSGATVDGQLDIDGSLELVDNPRNGFSVNNEGSPIDLPTGSISFSMIQSGLAWFLVGILGLLGGGTVAFKNYAAGILLGLSVMALIMSGTIGIGLEWFWAGILMTVFALMAGLLARWMTS